jgi:hypothetical protein
MLVKYNNNNVGRKAHTNTGETMEKEINNAINIIDKIYFLEEEKWNDYNNDYDEFKNDIPKLEKQLDLLIKFKKYLKNYNK